MIDQRMFCFSFVILFCLRWKHCQPKHRKPFPSPAGYIYHLPKFFHPQYLNQVDSLWCLLTSNKWKTTNLPYRIYYSQPNVSNSFIHSFIQWNVVQLISSVFVCSSCSLECGNVTCLAVREVTVKVKCFNEILAFHVSLLGLWHHSDTRGRWNTTPSLRSSC